MANDLAPDWILKQALGAQSLANADWRRGKPELRTRDDGLTMTFLGCGTMGIAILGGILASLQEKEPADLDAPLKVPTTFNACVRTSKGAKRVKDELSRYDVQPVIFENDNVAAVRDADVVLLGCKPQAVRTVLQVADIKEALKGKLLISISAGVSEAQLRDELSLDGCTVVRAMPNAAAAVRESMTVIGVQDPALPAEARRLVNWIFTRIGKVVHLPSSNMDACTSLCGAGPAFCSLMLESMAAGAIALGVPREEAYLMATQTMRGTTGLLQTGEHPALLRDKVTTPGGGTIAGLSVLEESGVRGVVAKAVREAAIVSGQLGSR